MADQPDERRRADPLCVGCGYDLRGLGADGACPECGTPVARSLRGDALTSADPAWLRRVGGGLLLVGIGWVLLIVWTLMWCFLPPLAARPQPNPIFWTLFLLADKAVVTVVILAGIVGVTALDPRQTDAERGLGPRRVARGGAIGALVVLAIHEGFSFAGGGFAILAGATYWLFVVLLVVAVVAATYQLARLMERIPEVEIAKRLRSYGRVFAVAIPVAVAGGVLQRVAGLGSTFVDGVILKMSVGGGLLALASAIGLMSAWSRARVALKLCIAAAETTPRA